MRDSERRWETVTLQWYSERQWETVKDSERQWHCNDTVRDSEIEWHYSDTMRDSERQWDTVRDRWAMKRREHLPWVQWDGICGLLQLRYSSSCKSQLKSCEQYIFTLIGIVIVCIRWLYCEPRDCRWWRCIKQVIVFANVNGLTSAHEMRQLSTFYLSISYHPFK